MNPPILDNYSIQLQAPAGGAVSPLNGEFYKGGQFMCNQFDMPKGYKQKIKKIVDKTAFSDNWREISVKPSGSKPGVFSVTVTMVTEKRSAVFHGSSEESVVFAKTLLEQKSEWYVAHGFMAHPTHLLIEGKV